MNVKVAGGDQISENQDFHFSFSSFDFQLFHVIGNRNANEFWCRLMHPDDHISPDCDE